MSLRPKTVPTFVVLLFALAGQSSAVWADICVIETFTISSPSGIVLDPQGQPLSGAQVEVSKIKAETIGHTLTDAKGAFFLPDIPSGKYELRIKVVGFQEGWLPIVVKRPKKTHFGENALRIVLIPGGPGCMSASLIKK
jgi:hypothetical protein